ncbi:MAG: biotin/lipoyl-binding protein [Bacteroidetes bacterium]|nr:biotin/lipoyl-binding protein [Bacteroidota bacterium]
MIKIKVNGKEEFTIENNILNGKPVEWDLVEIRDNAFHIIRDNKGYNAAVVSFNAEDKTMVVNVNGNDYEISIKDKYDLLLQKLGISTKVTSQVKFIKAPMPGLIIHWSVKVGDEVKKGDTLLILEAMKMENVIKSPRDGKVKSINAELRKPVEKNHVILEFE